MTATEVRKLLARKIAEAGSLRKWASANKISHAWVSQVISARVDPGPRIACALGLDRVENTSVHYRKRNGSQKG